MAQIETERFLSPDRKPALDPEDLRIKEGVCRGQFANKYTLQIVAAEAGLPVPRIVETPPQARQHLEVTHRNGRKIISISDETEIGSFDQRFFRRGYFENPVDMWAVDVLPTSWIGNTTDEIKYRSDVEQQLNSPVIKMYLERNFGLTAIPTAASFLQEDAGSGQYFSTLSSGDELFCTYQMAQGSGAVSWAHLYRDRVCDGSSSFAYVMPGVVKVLPIIRAANTIFNAALKGEFEYKHDLLLTKKGPVLIQSRVASTKISDEKYFADKNRVIDMETAGVRVIQLEVGELRRLDGSNDQPFILYLTNDRHRGMLGTGTMKTLDFRKMVGLKLPKGLAGGVLQHNGYNIIAYALYWGLPIVFE